MKDSHQKNRRALLKLMGLGGVATLGASNVILPKQVKAENSFAPKIAIIGAGLGGITMSAHLKDILPRASITLFDKKETMYYEPGFTLIAAGIYTKEDVEYNKADLIQDGITWIKEDISKIEPKQNKLKTETNAEYNYDYLIIATGVHYEFEKVKGLDLNTIHDPNSNITSIYTANGAVKARDFIQKLVKNGGRAVFAEPNTAIKCGGANKKVNFLLEDLAVKENSRDKVEMLLCVGGNSMLSSPAHAMMIEQFYIERKMPYLKQHLLVEVDTKNNIAIFDKLMPYSENGVKKVAKERFESKFDYLFVIPRMITTPIISEAGLGVSKGDVEGNWVDVDQYTLQHKKYDNIFAIGDCAGVPKGKTGASIRKQYPVIGANILSHLQGKELTAKFSGYTACPLLTRYGKAVMVEFDYEGTAPTLECMGATRESWMNWFVKVYLMKPMVMKAMINAKA
ncbi:NAD(P)/FAD-dependent oxidoreductase [Campylobacter sp. US33a]|uniref:NAD(P)/FAD-dependent oxidoreductase n=1 Tax=Campylobacter sp. US33a TaxID=2498120 RepID=UPI0010671D5C|nr:FAD-dependent oxidoreductase [Campylobacter sp. US33a]TEY03952.1 NAD(P)/FAD-dependent oxidoreductase [Campylobacter sp. US33a]